MDLGCPVGRNFDGHFYSRRVEWSPSHSMTPTCIVGECPPPPPPPPKSGSPTNERETENMVLHCTYCSFPAKGGGALEGWLHVVPSSREMVDARGVVPNEES